MTTVTATLTEIRADRMQKWERPDMDKSNHLRYIWLTPFEGAPHAQVGDTATLVWSKGTGGPIGGHWAGWRVRR